MAARTAGWPASSSGGSLSPLARLEAEVQQLRQLLERERGERAAGLAAFEERLARLERDPKAPPTVKSEPSFDSGFELQKTDSDSDDEPEGVQQCCLWAHRQRHAAQGTTYQELGELEDTIEFTESVWDTGVLLGTEYLSVTQSVTIACLMLLNIVIQFSFCMVVYLYMSDDSLSEDFLYSLLHFRTSIAHNVKYADMMTGRSLASQVCGGDEKLPWAGSQVGLVGSIETAKDGGVYLCVLVVLCWLISSILEVDQATRFGLALHSLVKPGGQTLIVNEKTDEDGNGQLHLQSISRARFVLLLLVLIIPRVIISVVLTYVGVVFLVVTTDMGDLILNALALAFITDIDDLLFAAFAARHIKTVMREIEPMTLPRSKSCARSTLKDWFVLNQWSKMALVFGLLAYVYVQHIDPFYWRMHQAWDILCSGNVDFVFAYNPATGIIQAAPTFGESKSELSRRERSILQMASITLASGPGFHVSQELLDVSGSPFRDAVLDMSLKDLRVHLAKFMGNNRTRKRSRRHGEHSITLTDLTPSAKVLEGLKHISESDVSQISEDAICSDMTASANVKRMQEQIQRLTEGKASHCKEAVEMCSWMNMTKLRALCPVSCGCRFLTNPAASFFASKAWGCPSSCENEFWLARADGVATQDILVTCADVEPARFGEDPALRLYISKSLEYFRSQQELLVGSFSMLSTESQRVGIPREFKRAAFIHLVSGGFVDDAIAGRWNIAPGTPHPRHLTGCAFWTSWEVISITGIDLCHAVGNYRTIRPYCPIACGCRRGGSQCPPSCTGSL